MEQYISYLGHNLEIGNKVKFFASDMTLRGNVIGFEKGKCIIQTTGCFYQTDEELEKIKSKARRQYRVNPSKCVLLVPKVA